MQQGQGANPKVDASGELPDGRKYADANEFKRLLLDDMDAFNRNFVEKLATYGLRRAVTFEDQQQLDAIAQMSQSNDYRLKSIIQSFVTSELFQQR